MTENITENMTGRFTIDRISSEGGQKMVEQEGLNLPEQEEIMSRCSELIVRSEKKKTGTCICPLRSGRYVIAVAYKVESSSREKRMHEVVRGIVVDENAMNKICHCYLPANQIEKTLFKESPDPENPEDWEWELDLDLEGTGYESKEVKDDGVLENFLEHMGYERTEGLKHAVRGLVENKYKIQLVVPEGMRTLVMSALYVAGMKEGVKLFITESLEATLEDPDVVILEAELKHMTTHYNRMTLEGFSAWGNALVTHHREKNKEKEKAKVKRQKEQKINALVELCRAYIFEADVSAYELDYRIKVFRHAYGTEAYGTLLGKVKIALYELDTDIIVSCQERFMEVLYMAFYEERKKPEGAGLGVCTSPYDFQGMMTFIKKKCTTRRVAKMLLSAMLRQQFLACVTGVDERFVSKESTRFLDT